MERLHWHDLYPFTVEKEPLTYLKTIPSSVYRRTRWWTTLRDRIRAEREHDGCEFCGATPEQWVRDKPNRPPDMEWNVHHLTYERLGEERDDDLLLVCTSCHGLIHNWDQPYVNRWLEALSMKLGESPETIRERALVLRPPWPYY